jgi:hypothetical protein
MKRNEQLFIIAVLIAIITGVAYVKKKAKLEKPNLPPNPHHQPYNPPQPPSPEPNPPQPKNEPEWKEYPPVRNVSESGLGKVLADIESHMPAGHIYRDADKITWGHETTHGINSNIRQKFSANMVSTTWNVWRELEGKPVYHNGRINGFYCLQNRAAVIEEPKVHIRTVAQMVPQPLRGNVYNLYLVTQAQSWGDTPLYIFDEWVAYTNGSEVRKDLGIQERSETVSQMIEFDIYALTLAMAVKQGDPNYDDKQFKAFLMWNIERSMTFLPESKSETYLQEFRTGASSASLRDFTKQYCGAEWSKRILGLD